MEMTTLLHIETKLSFGDYPIIAILSIGNKRTLRFNKVENNFKDISLTKKDKENISIDLN